MRADQATVTWLSTVTSCTAGLVVGSFLTVVVDRVPAGGHVLLSRSCCSSCRRILRPVELVPVASWLVLRGRCRSCGSRIGSLVPAVELVGAIAAWAVVARFGLGWEALAVAITVMTLIAQCAIDLRVQRLPREISWVGLTLTMSALVMATRGLQETGRLVGALEGAVVCTLVLAVVRAVSRGGLGDGDVRLAPLLGTILGWWNLSLVPLALTVASGGGAIVGGALILTRRADRRTPLPFGPFLALGTIVALWTSTPSDV